MVATPTDRQWWAMCDVNMSHPNPLHKADLTSPFVYERGFGLCYVPMGCHQSAMALLLAFQHGLYRRMEVVELLNLNDLSDAADYWLEHTPGAAFRSSVGKTVQAGSAKNLTVIEKRLFGSITYLS